MQLRWHEWLWGRTEPGHEDTAVVWECLYEVTGEAEEVPSLIRAEHEQAQLQHWSDAMKTELELGDDPEVAAAAPEGPEQIGVVRLRGMEHPSVGGDYLGSHQIV